MLEENNFNNQENAEQQPFAQPNPEPQPQVVYTQYIPYGFTPETYREKREIRKTATIVGIPLICLFLVGFVWSFVYFAFTIGIFKMSYDEVAVLSQNPAMQQILQIIISCLMFLLPFSVAVKAAGMRIDRLVKFSLPKKGEFLPYLLFGIGFCAFANIAMVYAEIWFSGFGIDYEVDFGDNPKGIFGFLLSFIATAIVPALVEEFACRGIVLGLLKKYGEGFAIVTSSVLFGIMHGNFEQIPFAVMVGLVLGYIYVKTESLWVCVAVHCVNNAVSVVFTYLEDLVGVNAQSVLYLIYLMAAMLLAVFGVCILSKKGGDVYSLKPSETAAGEKQKYKWFFASVFIVIFTVLNLIEACMYFVI